MPDNPGDAIKRLASRLREEAAPHGLVLRGFTFAPNFGDGPHMVQACFELAAAIDPIDAEVAAATADIDAGFEAMMLAERDAKLARDVEAARQQGLRQLDEG